MSQITTTSLKDIPFYTGEHSIPGIKFRTAGKKLGVTSWGMNVIELEAGCSAYPEHDHKKDGQEEVYIVLNGSGTLKSEGQELALEVGTLVRVGPDTKRKIIPGLNGLTVLALGATPGKAYNL